MLAAEVCLRSGFPRHAPFLLLPFASSSSETQSRSPREQEAIKSRVASVAWAADTLSLVPSERSDEVISGNYDSFETVGKNEGGTTTEIKMS